MTIAVVWQEHQALWTAADTRFSTPGSTTATQTVTDHGPKIFPSPIIVRRPGPSGFFDAIALQTAIGYVYAGEVGPALATHALCGAALQNLIAPAGGLPPSLSDVADFARATAERYTRNYAQRWPKHWRFATIVVGWCNVNHTLEAYQLIPELGTHIVVKSKRLDVSHPVAIGSGVQEFTDRLNSLRDGGTHLEGKRACLF